MELKEGYKQTEIGVIPEDWEVVLIENIAEIKTGDKNTQDKNPTGRYPFFIRSRNVERIDSYSFDCEAVLTAGDGEVGKVFHYINGKFDVHQRVYIINNFSKKILGYFFFLYFSNYFYNRIIQMTAKSTVDSVRRDMIAEMLIALPPQISEQLAISTALSDVDALLSSLDALIAKKRDLKTAAMRELLTGEKRLPGFKGAWEKMTLDKIALIKDGTHQTPTYVDSGIPFYSVENITNNNFTNNLKYISLEDHKSLSRYVNIQRNDILMTRIGVLGKCKLIDWDCEASFYVSLALIRIIDTNIDPKFLFYQLSSQYCLAQMELLSLPNAIPPKINLGSLSSIVMTFPPVDEQQAIAAILSDMDAEIAALESRRAKVQSLKQGMMQELLTGRTRLLPEGERHG